MFQRFRTVAAIVLALSIFSIPPASAVSIPGRPGASGVGDPYFPLDGNGGYDVSHYGLKLDYSPDTDVLRGVATIKARATQNLSSFNLDLVGLEVESVKVGRKAAQWSRDEHELTITPAEGIRRLSQFEAVITYFGIPTETLDGVGQSGFIATDDGTLVIGQPHVAATWYPVNDRPLDKAAYTFEITVPKGLEAIANGVLRRSTTSAGKTTWVWDAKEPMASYLTTATIGEFEVDAYRKNGIRYWDAIDPDLLAAPEPRTGRRFALSQVANLSYKRLMRTIDVPAEGGELSFWVDRDTEPNWDFMFVEAHPTGSDDWTTLPDENGHTSQGVGFVCPFWLQLHPFLAHYQTYDGNESCLPAGTTGEWWAATGASDGYEQWTVDLGAYPGQQIEVSISYASDDIIQHRGVVVDDVAGPGGQGSTSFERDADPLDGWSVPGAPGGSETNTNDWIVGTPADIRTVGTKIKESLARQPEIIGFLSGIFGEYPFSTAGGIVDDLEDLGFALEIQTRPIYSKDFFTNDLSTPTDWVVVHELAHQWVGDHVAIAGWQHIWLNEGFATYMEWLWFEREGINTAQEFFDFYSSIPADDEFWNLAIGDPGPEDLFDIRVYERGAATLHALRTEIGDRAFFRLLKQWVALRGGGNVTIPQFISLAERISGQNLDAFFDEWLFTPAKPASLPESSSRSATPPALPPPAGRGEGLKR